MDLQGACNILEELLEKDAISQRPKLNMKEFAALNQVLLEFQTDGKHVLDTKVEGVS